MRVLLIGGTGQISTGITKALVAQGDRVTVFNRGQTDDRLAEGVKRLHGDRNDFAAFEKQFSATSWDAVIDMICFNPAQAESDIRAFAGKTAHFIFCSTVCVYGNTQTQLPTPEDVAFHPTCDYARQKVLCEDVFNKAQESGKFGSGNGMTILRPSHTFGPGGRILNNLGFQATYLDRLRRGLPIIVSGDGNGLWATAYADDVGLGFAKSLGREKMYGEAFNITGDEVVTWDEYTRRTAAAIGAPVPKIVHIPTDFLLSLAPKRYEWLNWVFQYHGIYSNEKIRRIVPEFVNATPYAEGVKRTVAHMDAKAMIKPADSDDYEDKVIAAWEEFSGRTKEKLHRAD